MAQELGTDAIETRLANAREALHKFEARIWADGRDLTELTDDEGAEYDRLIAAEGNLDEQFRRQRRKNSERSQSLARLMTSIRKWRTSS